MPYRFHLKPKPRAYRRRCRRLTPAGTLSIPFETPPGA
ncbi:hypothetical protein C7388_10336 [Methylobacterium radiotolerans]|nr:hypothetical protein C7388_10336 [Methylobacterium organophilum]